MMKARPSLAATVLIAAVACQDSSTPSTTSTIALDNAFTTLPLGFPDVQSTFADSSNAEWTPGSGRGGQPGGDGGGMMCGGIGGLRELGRGFGLGRHLFPDELPGTCAYDASSGRVNCQPQTRNGVTVTRSAAYADASGAVQQAFDSVTTNSVNMQVAATGTRTRRDGNTTVQHSSDRTVTGLAQGSTELTVNGTSAGMETITGTDSIGTFNAARIIGDTLQNVIVPVSSSDSTYPSAGTIIRSMQVSATYASQVPTTTSRREVVTFDGSSTASVGITENGETRTCTLALPRGALTCS